ncbi:MAG: precorrin-3B C(17)-methyltransferase, partial [Chloroflexota bacterium]
INLPRAVAAIPIRYGQKPPLPIAATGFCQEGQKTVIVITLMAGEEKEEDVSQLLLISIGPGDLSYMIPAAREALRSVDVIIGYQFYLDQIEPLRLPHQVVEVSQLGSEIARAERAVEIARNGRSVAMVSSGDIGIYAMASPIFDVLKRHEWQGSDPEVVVYPGVSAIQGTAARLGAPLGHDFCTISLSNLLTPWDVIERRIEAAAWGDFVIGFYNPRSKRRDWQLDKAKEILLRYRLGSTPVVIARNMTRETEQITHSTLAELDTTLVDMFSLVLVGNSQSYRMHNSVVTPRGYMEAGEAAERGEGVKVVSTLYPITLNKMDGKTAVVVGGGIVGARKAQGVLHAGGRVRLISPEAVPPLVELAEAGRIVWEKRPFQPTDLDNADLVFAATNERETNSLIAQEAKARQLLCNVADAPAEGDFHSAAVLRQDGLVIAVNNEQRAPKRAVQIREEIRQALDRGGSRG